MAVRVERQQPAEGSNRPVDARAANDRIAEKAKRLRFNSGVPMLCECSTPGCQAIVMVSLDEYEEIRSDPNNFLTARGHSVERAELHERTAKYEIRRASRGEVQGSGGQRSA